MTAAQAAAAFAGRDFRVARSYRVAFAMTLASAVMSLIIFRFIAQQFDAVADYYSFVVIGMAMAAVLEGSVVAPGNAVRQEQVQGTLEVLASSPVSPSSLAAGWMAYPLAQSLVSAGFMIAIAGALGMRFQDPQWGVAALAVLVSAATFAGIGILGAAVVLVIQQSASLTRWITTGLALISGVFFKLEVLPAWIRWMAGASPLTHSLRTLRGALLEGKGLGDVAGDLAALVAFAIVLLPVSVWALAAAFGRARRRGTLGTY